VSVAILALGSARQPVKRPPGGWCAVRGRLASRSGTGFKCRTWF